MTLYQTIKGAYLAYLMQGERERLPYRPHDPKNSERMIHASSLGFCPLKRANERNRVPMKRQPSDAELLSSYHLMEQGTRDAEPFQESMVWSFGKLHLRRGEDESEPFAGIKPISDKDGSIAEYSVQSNQYKVRGRIDCLLQLGGQLHILELKRRDTPKKEEMPMPKLTDFYQLYSYRYTTGITNTHIITLNRYFFNIWSLIPKDNGYIFVNEIGEPWNSPFNDPHWLNHEAWEAEVARQHLYTFGGEIADPMSDENTNWQCGKWLRGEKPKYYKKPWQGKLHRPEFFVPSCPFWCHSDNAVDPVEYMEKPGESGVYIPFDAIIYPIQV